MSNLYIMRKGVSDLYDLKNWQEAFGDPGMGNAYYVNGGSDGPTGATGLGTKESPFQTFKEALAKCVSGNDDYIYVLNYGSNGRGAEDWPILVTKDQVHIIGLRNNPASKWSTVKPDEADSAFEVTGNRCEFAGLEIGGHTGGAGIEFTGDVWACWIHDCWFGYTGDTAGTNGIFANTGHDAAYLLVENCIFGVSLTGDGIKIVTNCTRSIIRNNLFYDIAGIAINLAGNVVGVSVLDNRFVMLAQTAGDAITFGATATGFVDGNSASFGKSTDTTKYWVSAGTDVNFGLNYVNGALLQPT
jgi:hypothetical protein